MIALITGISFFVLLGLGTPLYIIILALSGLLFTIGDIPLAAMVISFKRLEVQEFLSAIPLFTYAGYALSHSEVPKRIVVLSQKWLGWFTGSATAITVGVMALFTALTGASGVSILALGSLMYPLLITTSRDERFSYGLITGSGSIGLLLAPSLPVIIYGIISNQNSSSANKIDIDTLFGAALLPSALLFALYIGYGIIIERSGNKKQLAHSAAPSSPDLSQLPSNNSSTFNLKAALSALFYARWELPLPLLVYGGIYWGILTVLEASLIAFLYTFLLLFVIRREFTLKRDFIRIAIGSLKLSGGIFIIMASAFILTNYLVNERIPDKIFTTISPYLTHPLVFLLAINVFLLLTGCVLDIFSAILIVLPLVLPIVERYGIHPYHFAIIFLVNLEIGYLTPPIGLNLFIASYRFKKDIVFIYKAALPFLLLLLTALMLLTYIPSLSTFTLPTSSQSNLTPAESTKNRAPPPQVRDLTVASTTSTSITLNFTSTADPVLATDKKLRYKVIYIDEMMDDAELMTDLGEATIIDSIAATQSQNTTQITLTNLKANTTYSLLVITLDDTARESFPSIIITTQTLP
ncbi:C4-dicarboxylate TRAP transporter large permease protein DctM [Spirochaetota bacterium]|nr:C4-dicarboxylate TRAP transporter large permease protein DctM [Spirochaetota bacterium]